jgi:hypothetical protein
MVDKGTVRARQLARSRAEEVRIARFLANKRVTVAEMMEYCGERIGPLAAGRHVLAIQDTTEVNYQKHAGRAHGLGTVGNGRDAGLFLHPILAVDAESGACLGLIGAKLWLRTTAKAANYRALPIEAKESVRWLEGAETAKQALDLAAHVTMIGDRESDIYEEWVRLPDARFDLLTRACRDRALADGGFLFAFTDALPVAHTFRLGLPARPGKRAARTAAMAVRFGSVTIKRPCHCSDPTAPETLTLRVVDVREVAPPASDKEEPVHWRLLTTHAVDSVADAMILIGWYTRRWTIEQLHRTVKRQGLDLEASQAESADALLRLAALAVQVATRCLQLVLARDGATQQPAILAFEPDDLPVLTALLPTLQGRTQKQRNPHPAATLAWAAWIIARLGGWKGYPSESPPGPITMHRGLVQFQAIALGYRLATPPHDNR